MPMSLLDLCFPKKNKTSPVKSVLINTYVFCQVSKMLG